MRVQVTPYPKVSAISRERGEIQGSMMRGSLLAPKARQGIGCFRESMDGNPHGLQQGEVKLGHRGVATEVTPTPGLKAMGLSASDKNGEVFCFVIVSIGKTGSVNHHRVIKKWTTVHFLQVLKTSE